MDISDIEDDDEFMEILSVKNPGKVCEVSIPKTNPIKEHLMKELLSVNARIDDTKNKIVEVETVKQRILKKFTNQAAYRENVSSDSDHDLFTSENEPVRKKKRSNKLYKLHRALIVTNVWQRIIENKWIVGVCLQNISNKTLSELGMYVYLKDRPQTSGDTVFWSMAVQTFLKPIQVLEPDEETIATVALNLPVFTEDAIIDGIGMVFCEIDDKIFQTPVPEIVLTAEDTVDGNYGLDFSNDAIFSVVALKAIAIERTFSVPLPPNDSTRLIHFFTRHSFKEVERVCVAKGSGSLQFCLIALFPVDDGNFDIVISARSEAQLSIAAHLLRQEFPNLIDYQKNVERLHAAEALRLELELYLSSDDSVELRNARIKTDLLIP